MQGNSLQVADGMVVSIDYVLTLDDGSEVDRSNDDNPLPYLHGSRAIVSGLERALTGMRVGDRKRVMVQPEDGYGTYDPQRRQIVPRSAFPNGVDISEGSSVTVHDDDLGESSQAIIDRVLVDKVVLDLNHPLAGEKLFFAIKVADIRKATKDEIKQGHVI